jgi:hypothetical protein
MVVANLLDKFVLGPRLGMVLDLEALVSESVDGAQTDVFQQQQSQLIAFYRTQNFWLSDGMCSICAVAIVE